MTLDDHIRNFKDLNHYDMSNERLRELANGYLEEAAQLGEKLSKAIELLQEAIDSGGTGYINSRWGTKAKKCIDTESDQDDYPIRAYTKIIDRADKIIRSLAPPGKESESWETIHELLASQPKYVGIWKNINFYVSPTDSVMRRMSRLSGNTAYSLADYWWSTESLATHWIRQTNRQTNHSCQYNVMYTQECYEVMKKWAKFEMGT